MKSEVRIEVNGGALGDLVVCGMTLRERLCRWVSPRIVLIKGKR